MLRKLIDFIKDDEGATMVEYALMVALIAIVCILAVTALGISARDTFQEASDRMPAVGG